MGYISNIQRLSTEDGPGIRTTVFLKGCGLRCAWCHNPESLSVRPSLGIIREKCIGCGNCIGYCPEGALSLKDGKISIDDGKCTRCFRCVKECYQHVYQAVGTEWSEEALVERVLEDREYFTVSGGGVTFSGGEPLLQKDFVAGCIGRFHAEGIDTMVETALFCELDEKIVSALRLCSCLYTDLKVWDPAEHRKWTGQDNERILRNIRTLDDAGVRQLIRTPVIEGVNDTEEELLSIASFVKGLHNAAGYRLIPYHPYGLSKYDEFRRSAGYRNREAYDADRFAELERAVETEMEGHRI